ncbi:hypothetical protein [Paenibacillus lautus]|uniref:hypothetical protein n=1 Tax=Paenibacillus lautus TaxID=1401 RepID=UPI001C7CA1B3|nr:hypothetical protein [Paenibacillus lautus]MBX4152445.1 hypothetical protein [Paenibacillus lautus]
MSKPIGPTIVCSEDVDNDEDFSNYAISNIKTNSLDMYKMREMMKAHRDKQRTKLNEDQLAELNYFIYILGEMIDSYTDDINGLNDDSSYKAYLRGKRDAYKEMNDDLSNIIKI